MSVTYDFVIECEGQLDDKQCRAAERVKNLKRKRQQFESTRAAKPMPPRRGAPHRAARSATRTSLAGGDLQSGADLPVISVPDRRKLQRKKQLKKASVTRMLKPSFWPLQKPIQHAYTLQTSFFSPAASTMPNPTCWPPAEVLPILIHEVEEDGLDTFSEEQVDVAEQEDEEQCDTCEQQEELVVDVVKDNMAAMSAKEACCLDRQQVLGQLLDKLCAQNGGLQEQQVAAAKIQDLFTDLQVELEAVQKESKVLNNAVTCVNATQEKQPLPAIGKWPKLQEGTFNLVGRILEKAEARLESATVGINEHIGAIKLSNESLTSWPSSSPLQQQSEKVAQKFCQALGPVLQGAECLAKDAQSEFAKTAAVVKGRPPLFKTWLEDPFASVSKKLEAASQKFEADASKFMDRIEGLAYPASRNVLSSMD
eukprot:CAMPEP_0172788662 /NCGR_PEP_ID=MMETSP1074-20121228/207068_1 /TAXON_ID=2916 /ORGANISM="Ceratium fusus, Strain PA161109" /LENGTH=423 /DNA_ID=CAMNT_0013625693 /DNA_START=8 /DNA_END=1279 /DNA_ORIENTATION=-